MLIYALYFVHSKLRLTIIGNNSIYKRRWAKACRFLLLKIGLYRSFFMLKIRWITYKCRILSYDFFKNFSKRGWKKAVFYPYLWGGIFIKEFFKCKGFFDIWLISLTWIEKGCQKNWIIFSKVKASFTFDFYNSS